MFKAVLVFSTFFVLQSSYANPFDDHQVFESNQRDCVVDAGDGRVPATHTNKWASISRSYIYEANSEDRKIDRTSNHSFTMLEVINKSGETFVEFSEVSVVVRAPVISVSQTIFHVSEAYMRASEPQGADNRGPEACPFRTSNKVLLSQGNLLKSSLGEVLKMERHLSKCDSSRTASSCLNTVRRLDGAFSRVNDKWTETIKSLLMDYEKKMRSNGLRVQRVGYNPNGQITAKPQLVVLPEPQPTPHPDLDDPDYDPSGPSEETFDRGMKNVARASLEQRLEALGIDNVRGIIASLENHPGNEDGSVFDAFEGNL